MDAYNKLRKIGIETFDIVSVEYNGSILEGIIMPRTVFVGKNIVIIKLKNGYNIGINIKKARFKLIEKGNTVKKVKKEELDTEYEIAVLACGGTIASKVEYKTGAVKPLFSASEIFSMFPEVSNITKVMGRNIMSIASEDMHTKHWKIIAKEVYKEVKKNIIGVVITHGTDFMHYTSAALSFMLKNLNKPVVLTGAQRSSDRPSTDARVNFICSLIAAKSDVAEVTVCMHANINDNICFLHRGTRVRKMHTSRRDAFKSINSLPIAKINFFEKNIDIIDMCYRKRNNSHVKLDDKMNENVCIIKIHPSIKPDFIRKLSDFYDGIVIEVSGLGHVPTNCNGVTKPIVEEIANLVSSNIPVVVAPQTIYGALNLNVYENGRLLLKAGVIGNYCDWTSETAMVKLMWVLGHTRNMKKIKEMMLKNYCGEISERRWLFEDCCNI